jgi:purine nucleoside permease
MRNLLGFALCSALFLLGPLARADDVSDAMGAKIPVHVVVVTTFEIDNDTGDKPGEFQTWIEKLPLPVTIPFPQGYHHLRYNPLKQVLGIETGEGPVHMAASIEALANDPRFDFSHAYWILAGIAGVDPNAASVGSAAWAKYVVDGDLAYEIDAREIPQNWPTGYVPLGRSTPYQQPRPPVSSLSGVNLFTLNGDFVDWAVQLSQSRVTLADTASLQATRAPYVGFPKAQQPPRILQGDVLAAGTFWVGTLLNQWAENWVKYWSNGAATFTTTAEEDAGFMQALTFLSQAGQVDLNRVLVLRTASDYSVPPPGETAPQLLASEANSTGYSGFTESLSAAYQVGSSVVNELSGHWSRYRDHVPGTH